MLFIGSDDEQQEYTYSSRCYLIAPVVVGHRDGYNNDENHRDSTTTVFDKNISRPEEVFAIMSTTMYYIVQEAIFRL